MADDSLPQDRAVTPVSYTTGQSGHKLKWLPHRPGKPRRAGQVEPAQHLIEASSARPLRMAQTVPANDPFGDGRMPTPPAMLDDIPLSPPRGETGFDDAFPDLSGDVSPPGDLPATDPGAEVTYPPSENSGGSVPTMEEALAGRDRVLSDDCPRPEDILKPIGELTTDTTPDKNGEFPSNCPIGQKPFESRAWAPTTFTWKASGLCHKPLYFEDIHLERYGHSWGPYIQPVFSGAHFFLTVPILPYKMGLYPPHECMYTLGYYRPGSCAPYLLDPLPLSIRAAVAQGGVMTGMAYLMP
ncbi:MAG: hypothetical protein V3R99_06750 [Thermoguttaceae bacterium]